MTSNSPRGYTSTVIKRAKALDPSLPVTKFALLCIERDIPVTRIAREFDVTRATVYSWFNGSMTPRESHVAKMLAILEKVASEQA